MENNDNIIMSRLAFERMQAKEEKENRWKNIIIVILIALFALTNAAWLLYESQFETVAEDYTEVDAGEGDINYIGHNGDINNGTGSTQKNSNEAQG